jgi:simple sugar transport system permease protein
MMATFAPFLRRPEAASVISLLGIVAFYMIIGGVDLRTLFGAASWLNFAANLGIVAIPVGILMIGGQIDISIGAMIPAGSMTIAILSGYYGLPIGVGIIGTLALGAVVGLVNGLLTVRTTVPSLIVTLGTLVVMQGVVLAGANLLTGAASVKLEAPAWAKAAFGSLVGPSHQVIIFWWVVVALLFAFAIHKTRFGNWVYAMGGDLVSARNAGVPTARLTIILFMLSAVSAAFVGMCGAIQFNSAQVSGGMGYIFNTIVSIVVGGVLLTGGFGSVIGICIGTITFAIVSQGIYFTQIDRNWSNLIIGVTLLLAVAMNESFRKFALRAGPRKRAASS